MKADATDAQIAHVCDVITELGLKPHSMPGATRTAIGITGNQGAVDPTRFENLPGVADAIRVSKPYKLISLDLRPEKTIVRVGDATIGGDELAIIAGPCAVESHAQAFAVAEAVRRSGARFFRGGAFKPRTSPYAFQGMEDEGLVLLENAGRRVGLPVVTEIMDGHDIDLVAEHADMLQVGARNAQNFSLLRRLGKVKKPILLKRGMSTRLDEFLMAAEYILSEGNYNVMLCERGVRTFSDFSRNTLDLAVVPAVKKRSHLPIFVDPSHGTGKRHKVLPLSRAAVAVGADGLLVEVHHQPEKALSDGIQSILPEEFAELSIEIRQIAAVVHREVN